MSAHLKQDKPDDSNRLDQMAQGVIGKPLPRLEGLAKVTGTAPYAAEYRHRGLPRRRARHGHHRARQRDRDRQGGGAGDARRAWR